VEFGAIVLIALFAVVAGAVIVALLRFGGAPARTAPPIAGATSELQRVKVRHVIDGDTVIIARSWSEYSVRLDSIDCPEDGQYWGNIAKAGLIKLIGGRHVYIETHGNDIHGRMLATVYVQHGHAAKWINVNERMVMLGHAWVLRKHYRHLPQPRQHQLDRLERWAKSKRVGLWNSNSPIPPWRWRRQE
jgi:endonuclease YncB( thermonuclease family)